MSDEGCTVIYELWVKGSLGVHKDKLVLCSVHLTHADAQRHMMKVLKKGDFATITRKEVKINNEQ